MNIDVKLPADTRAYIDAKTELIEKGLSETRKVLFILAGVIVLTSIIKRIKK